MEYEHNLFYIEGTFYVLQNTTFKSPALLTGQPTKIDVYNHIVYTNTNQFTSKYNQIILLYNNHITYENAPASVPLYSKNKNICNELINP